MTSDIRRTPRTRRSFRQSTASAIGHNHTGSHGFRVSSWCLLGKITLILPPAFQEVERPAPLLLISSLFDQVFIRPNLVVIPFLPILLLHCPGRSFFLFLSLSLHSGLVGRSIICSSCSPLSPFQLSPLLPCTLAHFLVIEGETWKVV